MEHFSQPATSPTFSSFAGLLASLAARVGPDPGESGGAQIDDLVDDVATISHESALRAQAMRSSKWDEGPARSGDSESNPREMDDGVVAGVDARISNGIRDGQGRGGVQTAPDVSSAERSRKGASITIRMSEKEGAQLRQRATEAGLSVSAYLRSCVFEVENLRAQVKATVAQLKAAGDGQLRVAAETPVVSEAEPGHWFWPFSRHTQLRSGKR